MTNNIDKVLRQKNKTVTWLANKVGTPKLRAFYAYCENSRQPPAITLFRIAKALDVSMEELIRV